MGSAISHSLPILAGRVAALHHPFRRVPPPPLPCLLYSILTAGSTASAQLPFRPHREQCGDDASFPGSILSAEGRKSLSSAKLIQAWCSASLHSNMITNIWANLTPRLGCSCGLPVPADVSFLYHFAMNSYNPLYTFFGIIKD